MLSGWIQREPTANDPEPQERPGSWAFQMALSLLGPLFFLSGFLSVLAPLPLLYLYAGTPNARRGRLWAAAATLIGLLLCLVVQGPLASSWLGSLLFFLFAALPALVLGELLLRHLGPDKAVAGAMLAVALAAFVSAWGIARSKGVELLPAAQQLTQQFLREKAESLLSQGGELSDETRQSLQEIKDSPGKGTETLPGVALFAILLLCALPCVALVRWNPKGFLRRTGIPRDYLRKWAAPEWLVWPALLCGGFHLFEVSPVSEVARNALIPILLIYFFHGMSILAYFLDSLRLRGPFRILFYGTAVLFLTPMVVSFGFFDLWFGFRNRNRQKDGPKEGPKDGDEGGERKESRD